MELTGDVLMEAPRERVWQALNDAQVLRECIPGCEEVQDDSPTERRVRVMVKVGPVRARFSGRVKLSEVEAPLRCLMAFEGSGGAAGMASGQSRVELTEEGAGTRLSYTVKASVGGKLGQVGGRMMDASAKQLADQFFEKLRAHLAPAVEAVQAGAPGAAAGTAAVQGHRGTGFAGPLVAPPEGEAPQAPRGGSSLSGPAAAPPRGESAGGASAGGEFSRVLWFVLGAASTAFGVWLGAHLFH